MKRQTIIALGFLFSSMLQAQEKQQYLHLTVGGGLHHLSYDLQNGTQNGRFGNTINAGYSYFFTKHWGVQSGLGLQWFNARSTVNYLSATPQVDMDGETFEFRANYNNWQEKQQALFMDIPLTLQYRHALSSKISLQGSAGGKISIPISSSFKTTGGSITTTGYYSRLNAELSDLPAYGFRTISNSYDGTLSLRPSYMAIADVGGLYTLSPKVDLYLGAYINYGLNNAVKAETKEAYQYDGVYNGVLASNQAGKVTPISIGLKLGVYFRLTESPKVIIADKLPLITRPAAPVQKTDTVIAPQKEEAVAVVVTEQPVVNPSAAVVEEKIVERPLEATSTITINFTKNSNETANEKSAEIKALREMLNANPNRCLQIIGHTCNWGTRRNNLRVGLRRADSVKTKLNAEGVPANKMTTESKGESEPLVPNTSDANREKNRRVEIRVENCIR
jgi:OmpA-OmpF porin, OOP family